MDDGTRVVTTERTRKARAAVPNNAGLSADAQYDAVVAVYAGLTCPADGDIRREVTAKVAAYAAQDVRAHRPRPEALNFEAAIEKLIVSSGRCLYCRKRVRVLYSEVRDPIQWTLDRVDNSMPHDPDNVVVACLGCNLARRRTIQAKFLMAKRLKLEKVA
jgi:hypothetical protein